MLKQAAVIAVAACAAVLAVPAAAFAGGGSGAVQCQGQECTLYAQNPGSPGRAGLPGMLTAAGGQAAGGPAAKPACTVGGVAGTWIAYVGRYGYTRACVTPGIIPGGAAPAAARAAAPAPAVLAQAAESRLGLGSPVIQASPAVGLDQLAHVPTWLWLAGPWAPVRATAAVPGEQVTATATPQRVTWHMGDGSMVTCRGPGTPYQPSGNPAAPSPTCGHTYARSSAAAPGGKFTVTATITWDVTWAGGGGGGAFPGLVTTSAVRVPVAQSQAIVTGPAS
jgi:hypothetical protein